MDWCHVAAKCESTVKSVSVKSPETFVVLCCNDLMGQLSSETAGLPITGRTGNIPTCLDITWFAR